MSTTTVNRSGFKRQSRSRGLIHQDKQYGTPPAQKRWCDLNTKPAPYTRREGRPAISIQRMSVKLEYAITHHQCNDSRYCHSPIRVSGSRSAAVLHSIVDVNTYRSCLLWFLGDFLTPDIWSIRLFLDGEDLYGVRRLQDAVPFWGRHGHEPQHQRCQWQ